MKPQPFFYSLERLLQLEQIALSWRGTPFMPNAALKGAGVSCQKLVGAIYTETGVVAPGFTVPDGPMNWSAAHHDSLIAAFMDQQPNFAAFEFPGALVQPGDMLGFRIGGCIHHCAVLFRADGTFIHCLRRDGVRLNNVHDASYWTRLARIWRPLAHHV